MSSQLQSPVRSVGRATSERYLTFRLGGEVYALDLKDVTEIMEYRALTVVPMMPSFIRGVINLRGRVVPVVDLAVRFGHGSTELGRRAAIVIVELSGAQGAGRQLGIMVDAVNKVVHLEPDDIEPSPVFGAGIRADFITGMAKQDDAFTIVLDISQVMTLDDLPALDQAVHLAAGQPTGESGDAPA